MEISASQVLSVGDQVSATGILMEDGSQHRLAMQAEGLYGEILNVKQPPALSISVQGLSAPPLDRMVTVRGIWSDGKIENASVADGGRGVETPPRIEPTSFPDVPGAVEESEILNSSLDRAFDTLRNGPIVAFLALRGPQGWFGVASAVDAPAVRSALEPILNDRFVIVPSDWSINQVDEALEMASVVTDPCLFGYFWDERGRFRAEIVVDHMSSELASALAQLPTDILHVATWLRRED